MTSTNKPSPPCPCRHHFFPRRDRRAAFPIAAVYVSVVLRAATTIVRPPVYTTTATCSTGIHTSTLDVTVSISISQTARITNEKTPRFLQLGRCVQTTSGIIIQIKKRIRFRSVRSLSDERHAFTNLMIIFCSQRHHVVFSFLFPRNQLAVFVTVKPHAVGCGAELFRGARFGASVGLDP